MKTSAPTPNSWTALAFLQAPSLLEKHKNVQMNRIGIQEDQEVQKSSKL
jgi:hypothetical protein